MARNAFNLIVAAVAAVAVSVVTASPEIGLAVFSLASVALGIVNRGTPSANLDDLRANKSAYGEFIPIAYNTVRLGAHLVWASKVRAKKRTNGGYEYGQDCRWVICEVPRQPTTEVYVTARRIFLNKQLVYSIVEDDKLSNVVDLITTTVQISALHILINKTLPFTGTTQNGIQVITIYHGEPTQLPSPLQVADLGADNTPAYRGVLSIEIANLPLHLYGNAIPQLEVEVEMRTLGTAPGFIAYDPAWKDGHPLQPHTEWTGYRAVAQILASPTYRPNTIYLLMMDNEEIAGSRVALGRRDAMTGEWEKTDATSIGPLTIPGVEKVALLSYEAGDTSFIWDQYMASIYHPPTGSKIYSTRFKSQFTGGPEAFWWVQWEDDYPFTFLKKSQTPQDKGRTGSWQGLWSATSNADGSMLAGLHNGSGSNPKHVKWSMWAPGPNIVSYFRSDDAAFAGLWTTGSGSPNHHMPQGLIIDKHDHLWIWTAAALEDTTQLHLDEFSWTVGATDITLTHLNRYALINQDSGHNTWAYNIPGVTYNEVLDEFVLHWVCSFPSPTYFGHDPFPDFTPYNFSETFNDPSQYRITHWDLATRSKKLSEADSVRLKDESKPNPFFGTLYYMNFGAAQFGVAGIAGFLGTETNYSGDRFPGTWTQQNWTVYVGDRTPLFESLHTDIYLVNTTTGIGVTYGPRLWDDFIDPDYPLDSPPGNPGVYWFAGTIYEPTTQAFWAGRRGDGGEGDFTDASEEEFLGVTQGFGRYFINVVSVPQPWTLEQINDDIAERTGTLVKGDDFDFSALAGIAPSGYSIGSRRAARASIDELRGVYLYDVPEEDWLLVAHLREDLSSLVTIDESQVVVDGETRRFVFTDDNEQEVPRYIDLKYFDITRMHQTGVETARIGGGSLNDRNAVTIAIPVVMTPDEAATAAQKLLRSGWIQRKGVKWSLAPKYLKYGAADVVRLTRGTLTFEVQIANSGLGLNWAMAFESVNHDSGTYSIVARGKVTDPLFIPSVFDGSTGGAGGASGISIVPEPYLIVVDTNLVEEADDTVGLFVTAIPLLHEDDGGRWSGADLEQGVTDTAFTNKGRIVDAPSGGIVLEALPSTTAWATWDRTSVLKAKFTSGAPPVSIADETRLWKEPGLNLGYLENGEQIQYATASPVGNNEYWFTNLLRGRNGTEQFVDSHLAGESFIIWDKTKFLSVTYDAFLMDKTRYWRAKNDWQGTYSDVVTSDQRTRRLMPWAPYFIRGTYDSGNNLTGTFLRRSRTRGTFGEEPPLFEAEEEYEVDIMSVSGGVVRTITSTASAGGSVVTPSTRTVYYSAVDQLADWGSLQPSYDVEVYQMNAIRGRGYPGRATL